MGGSRANTESYCEEKRKSCVVPDVRLFQAVPFHFTIVSFDPTAQTLFASAAQATDFFWWARVWAGEAGAGSFADIRGVLGRSGEDIFLVCVSGFGLR